MVNSDSFDTVDEAIAAVAAGRLVVVADNADRENEGDLIMAASAATPETVNMMIRYGSGIVCVPMLGADLDRLHLRPMVARNREVQRTDFSVSVDAAAGITTGVSTQDRQTTIRILADPASQPDHLVQPGHVFPLRARPGGVLERAGHTEAAVDLARLAGLAPVGVLCELVNEDGSMQRLPELLAFKQRFGLKMISVEQLIAYRLRRDSLIEKISERDLPSEYGLFRLHVFRSRIDQRVHLALVMGQPNTGRPALVRVHSANLIADVFHAKLGGDSGHALASSLKAVAAAGSGAVLYMQSGNQSESLLRQLQRAAPGVEPDGGMDLREYGVGAQMLRELGLTRIRLLTQHAKKVVAIDGFGVEILEQIQID